MGDFDLGTPVSRESSLKYHPGYDLVLTLTHESGQRTVPCRVSSDLHERRKKSGTEATSDPVRVWWRRKYNVPAVRRKDPVNLYCRQILG